MAAMPIFAELNELRINIDDIKTERAFLTFYLSKPDEQFVK